MRDLTQENMVKSVGRALDIIRLISNSRNGMGVTEIANQMDINKSSVYRILATLAQYGYVEKDHEHEKYKLGYTFLDIGARLLESIDLRKEAMPYLLQLEEETNEVIHLVVYDQGEVVYIEKLEGTELMRMHSQGGKRAPMHCTSVGKAILAYLPEEKVKEILSEKGMPAHTEYTYTNEEDLFQDLQRIRQYGYALDLEENEYGITCVAIPLFDYNNHVCAAVSVSGSTIRMTKEKMEKLYPRMTEIGQQISLRLGCKMSFPSEKK